MGFVFLRLKWLIEGFLVRIAERCFLAVVSVFMVLLGAGMVWWIHSTIAAHRHEKATRHAWKAMGRPLDSILTRYPSCTTNPSAVRLESLAAELGINLVPRAEEDLRKKPDEAVTQDFISIKAILSELAPSIARGDTDEVVRLPPELVAFLKTHDETIDAIIELLLKDPLPVWLQEPAQGIDAPIPGLLGHLQLSRLLISRAAALLDREKLGTATRTIDAAWKLRGSCADRVELLSQLIGEIEAQEIGGIARCHPKPPAYWIDMFLEHDSRKAILDSFHFEAWSILDSTKSLKLLFPQETRLQKTASLLILPFMRNQMCFTCDALGKGISELPDIPFTEFKPGESYAVACETRIGERKFARLALNDIWSVWSRVGNDMLSLELSVIVFELRRTGPAVDRLAPVVEQPSRIMPSVTWRISRENGGFNIRPVEELPVVKPKARSSLCRSFFLEISR